MTKSEKKERKEKIKNRFFKVLHIISYVLSVAFLGICIIAGVQSCNKQNKTPKQQNSINQQSLILKSPKRAFNYAFEDYDIYELYYTNYVTLTRDYMIELETFFNIEVGSVPAGSSDIWRGSSLNAYIFNGSNVYNFTNTELQFKADYFSGTGSTYYYLYHFYLWYNDGNGNTNYIPLCNNISSRPSLVTGAYEYTVGNANGKPYLIFDNETSTYFENSPLSYFFRKVDISYYELINNFNYNYPFGYSFGNDFIPDSANVQSYMGGTYISGDYFYVPINIGFFAVDDTIFDTMLVEYLVSDGSVIVYDGFNPYNAPNGSYVYTGLYYVQTDNNFSVKVNSRNTTTGSVENFSSNGEVIRSPYTAYSRGSTWLGDTYRYITWLTILNEYDILTLQGFNNTSGGYNNGGNGLMGQNNVFILLSQAFTSLNDFWSIAILPGITIGALFFLPAIVSIVIAVFWVLKR